MKGSEIIKELQEYIKTYGDAEVKISNVTDCRYYLISEIYYSIDNNSIVIE